MKKHIVSISAICKESKFAKYEYTENALYIFSAWSVYRLEKDEISETELIKTGFVGFDSHGMTADYDRMLTNDPRLYKKPLECVHIPDKSISKRRVYKQNSKYIGIDFKLAKPYANRIASIYAARMNFGKAPVMCFDKDGKFLCSIMPYCVNQNDCKKRFERIGEYKGGNRK